MAHRRIDIENKRLGVKIRDVEYCGGGTFKKDDFTYNYRDGWMLISTKGGDDKVDKHTFKVGDIIRYYFKKLAPVGTLGVVTERREVGQFVQIWSKALDRAYKGVDGWLDEHVADKWIKHDTDFQVGDWVRYEAVVPYTEGYDTENGKVGQITHLGKEVATIKGELNRNRFISNLVKIQPPQEDKKMDIKRKEDGAIVRDVKEAHKVGYKWIKYSPDCRTEYSEEYWEPVEEWVKIEVRKSQWETINTQIGTFEAWGVDQNYHTVSWRPVK